MQCLTVPSHRLAVHYNLSLNAPAVEYWNLAVIQLAGGATKLSILLMTAASPSSRPAYRVCQNQRTRPLTAYEQQRSHLILQCNDLSTSPQEAMLSSLTIFLIKSLTLLGKQHEILLMCWDANSILSDPEILLFMHQCSLFDLHASNDFPPAANTSSKGRRIHFIFGTSLLRSSVRKGGILSFQQSPFSDHRAIYVDLEDEDTLFRDSSTDPTAPTQHQLRHRNLSQFAKYLLLAGTRILNIS